MDKQPRGRHSRTPVCARWLVGAGLTWAWAPIAIVWLVGLCAGQHHYASISQIASGQQDQLEQQLVALANSQQVNQISALKQQPGASQVVGGAEQSGSRSRTPRSIGEMFKKLFNGNKRSKQSSQPGGQARDWDQQQQQQQQQQFQQQQLQQHQNQAMAASLAAAAANQHAVYASPFAAYSPPGASPASAALYAPQFAPYSGAGLVAWPATTAASLAQALRPTIIGPASTPMLSSSGPLYAAASQSYGSYAAAPSQQIAGSSAGSPGPQPAASHSHASAVPAPAGMSAAGSSPSGSTASLDFHQVLDALVRTSGFAPAGDQEAAAASYGSKSDATPVFSFKKLVSLPFYLSTEDKSLEGLAGAYSPHSMPIMRRHVRRMSATPSLASSQNQQSYASLQGDSTAQYNNYLNAINSQLATLAANNQLISYLSQQSAGAASQASPMDAYSAEAALANYQALAALNSPYKSSGIGNRNGVAPSSSGMATAASMVSPMAVQPPQGLFQQHQSQQAPTQTASHQKQHQQQYEQVSGQELQNLINSMQQLSASAGSDYSSAFGSSLEGQSLGQPQHYWPSQIDGAQTVAQVSQVVQQPQSNVMDHQQLNQLASQQQQQHHHHHHHNLHHHHHGHPQVSGSAAQSVAEAGGSGQAGANQSAVGTQQVAGQQHHAAGAGGASLPNGSNGQPSGINSNNNNISGSTNNNINSSSSAANGSNNGAVNGFAPVSQFEGQQK